MAPQACTPGHAVRSLTNKLVARCWRKGKEGRRERERGGATQAFGATRARLLKENLGDFAPSEVVAPRSDGAARTAKYQAALDGGHDVLVLISEVWGGFSPEAMRLLGELAQARNDGVDLERANATWSTSSFTSYHGQLLSLAVQRGVAIEIERAIKKSASF